MIAAGKAAFSAKNSPSSFAIVLFKFRAEELPDGYQAIP
jgi:hypothetical protein